MRPASSWTVVSTQHVRPFIAQVALQFQQDNSGTWKPSTTLSSVCFIRADQSKGEETQWLIGLIVCMVITMIRCALMLRSPLSRSVLRHSISSFGAQRRQLPCV